MITELVLFDLPKGITREQVVSSMRESAQHWRRCPELVRKNYLYDPHAGHAGGVYLWPDRSAAQPWHDESWRQRIRQLYGSEPVIRYFDTPLVVDNVLQDVIERAEV